MYLLDRRLKVQWSTIFSAHYFGMIIGSASANQPALSEGNLRRQRLPSVFGHARNDAEPRLAQGANHRRFTFCQVIFSGDGAKRIAVADDDKIGARWRRRGQESTQLRVTFGRIGMGRSAPNGR